MVFDHYRAAIDLLIAEITRMPEDAQILLEQLQLTLARIDQEGRQPPPDLVALRDWIAETMAARGEDGPPPGLPEHFMDWRERRWER